MIDITGRVVVLVLLLLGGAVGKAHAQAHAQHVQRDTLSYYEPNGDGIHYTRMDDFVGYGKMKLGVMLTRKNSKRHSTYFVVVNCASGMSYFDGFVVDYPSGHVHHVDSKLDEVNVFEAEFCK